MIAYDEPRPILNSYSNHLYYIYFYHALFIPVALSSSPKYSIIVYFLVSLYLINKFCFSFKIIQIYFIIIMLCTEYKTGGRMYIKLFI